MVEFLRGQKVPLHMRSFVPVVLLSQPRGADNEGGAADEVPQLALFCHLDSIIEGEILFAPSTNVPLSLILCFTLPLNR